MDKGGREGKGRVTGRDSFPVAPQELPPPPVSFDSVSMIPGSNRGGEVDPLPRTQIQSKEFFPYPGPSP